MRWQQLAELDRLGLLTLAPTGPIEAHPERGLADRLAGIAEPRVRAAAEGPLTELVAARDAVAAASGSAEQVLAATAALSELFARHTGQAGTRRSGSSYAGRTLVYQDTVRDVRDRGRRGGAGRAGRAAGRRAGQRALAAAPDRRAGTGRCSPSCSPPKPRAPANPSCRWRACWHWPGRSCTPPVAACPSRSRRCWPTSSSAGAEVLGLPATGSRHQVSCAAIAAGRRPGLRGRRRARPAPGAPRSMPART